MTAKEYLSQALWTERRIAEIREEIQRLRELACSVSGAAGEHTGSSSPGDRVGRAGAEIVYLEEMLHEETKLYSQQYREIKATIDKVDDARYREILRRRYIRGETLASIGESMHYSGAWVCRLLMQALVEVERVCRS